MGKYLKLFDTHAEYESFIQTDFDRPNVSYCMDNDEVHYNPLPYQGFCKLALNDGSIVELEGSGELVSTMIDSYKASIVSAEIGELCTTFEQMRQRLKDNAEDKINNEKENRDRASIIK